MDGTRIAALDDLPTDDTFLFRVRSLGDVAVASGAAALQSDDATAAGADGLADGGAAANADGAAANADGGGATPRPDDGIQRPDDAVDAPDSANATDADANVREAILVRLATDDGEPGDHVACWLNYCQHMTHVTLDKGTGAPVRGGEVVCANHGAMFETATGECTYGPCEGAFLNGIEVSVRDGAVYLTDEDYEYVGDGPIEREDDDLSSTSNVIL